MKSILCVCAMLGAIMLVPVSQANATAAANASHATRSTLSIVEQIEWRHRHCAWHHHHRRCW